MRFVLDFAALVLVSATVLSEIRSTAWWVRMCDFPRIQIAAGIGVAATVYLVSGRLEDGPTVATWLLFGALVAAGVVQAWRMATYTPLHPKQTVRVQGPLADPDRRVRLMVTNVLMENRDGERWLRTVREADPDVIAAVETDAWWAQTAAQLADEYPHAAEVPQDDTYGMLVRSRLPLSSAEVRHLVEPEVPSLFLTMQLQSGEEVQVVVLHPRPPRPDIQQDSTLRDAELVLAGRSVSRHDRPVIVCGDLNDVAWSQTTALFQKVSGLLDPRVGRGTFSTFHADHWWLRYPLDHVFHSEHFALVELRRLPSVGSDHFPILVELELSAPAEAIQDPVRADAEDREDADDAVEQAAELTAHESPEEHRERVEKDQ